MFDNKNRFVIENYNKQSCFASFLPGISGIHGTPLWNFYVNRGQAICSFGSENKDHSIMEFYPAHQSYQFTKTMGFRTFLKVDGTFYEPFVDDDMPHKMYIGMNELEIEETNEALGIKVNVLYYTMPNERLGGLVRTVTITNLAGAKKDVEVLDGTDDKGLDAGRGCKREAPILPCAYRTCRCGRSFRGRGRKLHGICQ